LAILGSPLSFTRLLVGLVCGAGPDNIWLVKPVAFDDLLRLPAVQYYATAFRRATGVSLKVVPPGGPPPSLNFGEAGNGFCALAASTPKGCIECLEAETRVQRSAARKLSPQQIYCFAGMTVIALPVLIGTTHVATLLSGQIFRREPTERDYLLVLKMLGVESDPDWRRKLRKAYFDTPVLTADQFQGALHLLQVFGQYLADFASRQAIACSAQEPVPVTNAKRFVQLHVEEPITLEQVVQHVHVSRFYFCKLFKKATGMTLTEYVARARVEKAKTLLGDYSLRISDVVYAAGFGSIPRFNSVFKRYVGVAPTEYRGALKAQAAA
jgi:AraC-like DNA-binding protein/ligand-binding sensor protein